MTGKHIVFLILVSINALVFVANIGKPRKPITPFDAVANLVEWALLALLALS